ncbi:MAG TPA: hypothetical protein VG167_00355 [Verrucomicrobiae bacterium]|nr:hypothetical protein [Verrucomicrobiae bacterium]
MTKQTLMVLGLILVVFLGLVTLAVLKPLAARPNVTVRFAGYTNDTTGTRLAVFTMDFTESRCFASPSLHHPIQLAV